MCLIRVHKSSLTFLSQRSQLRSHFLQGIFQLRAAIALFVQSYFHVAVLQRHRLDGGHRGNLALPLTLTLTLTLGLGLGSHGSQQVLSTTPKQTLRQRNQNVLQQFETITLSLNYPLVLTLVQLIYGDDLQLFLNVQRGW